MRAYRTKKADKVERFLKDFEKLIKKHKLSKADSSEIIEILKHKILETEEEKFRLYIE